MILSFNYKTSIPTYVQLNLSIKLEKNLSGYQINFKNL